MSSSGNSPLNVPSFPEASQLSGQDTWRAFKDRVDLNVQVRGLKGYLEGSISKPTSATYIYTAQTSSPNDSQFPSPGEWFQRDRMVASIINLNCTDPIGIGLERDDAAHKMWQYLIKKYEARDEQRIHMADTRLREHKFDPEATTMEAHEKKMKNLLKALHNLGGSCNDYQFRLIVIASMPEAWRDHVLNVPGVFSSEAFTYLHRLYLDKLQVQNESVPSVPTHHAPPKSVIPLTDAGLKVAARKAKPQSPGRTSSMNSPKDTGSGYIMPF
ncbi:hypothetical protein BT96DRAFT_946566 [Gymnopus androsaceus JB14]|uniref:Uncharacterized protein n=1 Tax=Gymnopus androsaceus JB14 TaxID=1447944 RepID=A0A6A4GWW6_9AGAR|nr:hypothetical protein BT96DRAFT_946566 [Gymnopus androsaceus JB14]